MAFLWSNPNQQGHTAAQLTAGTQINPINMQGVVAAILENQRLAQQRQMQQQQQISQGVNSLAQRYQQGEQDDLANRALYAAQNPTDPYRGQPGYDERVPDYGGTDALKMQQIQAQIGNQGLNTDLLKQRILAEAALARQRTLNPIRGVTPNQQAIQQRFEERQALGDVNQQIKDLNTGGGLTATGGARISRDTLDSSEQVHQGTGPGGEYIPEGYYGIGGKRLETVVPASEFDKAHVALNRYNEMLSKTAQGGGEGDLRAQAQRAIQGGADAEAVSARYKQLTGQDL